MLESFTQADGSLSRPYGGTGLGLAIVQRGVTLLGGDLHAESALGRGTLFSFALDLQLDGSKPQHPSETASPHPAPHPGAAAGPPLAGARILLVEDNSINQQVAREILERFGARVAVARHGGEAVDMFAVSDLAAGQHGVSTTLEAATALDLRIIDLGGGIREEARRKANVAPEDITSRPFAALLSGLVLTSEDTAPRPVSFRGFLSVVSEQMLARPLLGRERFGERSYAVISDKYLNFSSRIGYHYGVLDCYCGATVNKNYITFTFSGGAADDVKRARRARAIARILASLGFGVDTVSDRVAARFQKFPAEVIAERLGHLGRLLQFTRQTDMLAEMQKRLHPGGTDFAKTHPAPADRIAQLAGLARVTEITEPPARVARFKAALGNI